MRKNYLTRRAGAWGHMPTPGQPTSYQPEYGEPDVEYPPDTLACML